MDTSVRRKSVGTAKGGVGIKELELVWKKYESPWKKFGGVYSWTKWPR